LNLLGRTGSSLLEQTARRAYEVGVRRWRTVTISVAGMAAISGLLISRMPMQEDVAVMLPDSDPAFVAGYRLLEAAPFTRNILIDLEAQESEQLSLLTETAERLSERLGPPWISRVIGSLSMEMGTDLLDWLYGHAPQLFTKEDAAVLATKVTCEQVTKTLQSSLDTLIGPEGTWLRHWLGRDPLEFRNQVFRKLGAVAVLPEARIEGGFLVDPTGRHVLLVAETPVAMSDSRAGEQMLRYVNQAIAEVVPAPIRAHVVCAHRYTVANAATIKQDLVTVFMVSSIAMVVIFLLLLRHWRALFVFAVPSLAVLAAVLLTALVFGGVSAITVGFGAVLLGMADDYGLHVFFALRRKQSDPARSMAHLAVPEAISWLTTVGIFVVLLRSGIPIQRQLAVFSIVGLAVALILAFLWLPRWVMGGKGSPTQDSTLGSPVHAHWITLPAMNRHWQRWIVAVWLVLTVALVPVCCYVQFDGDLRRVGVTPREVLADERCVRDVWADPRGHGLLVVQADDMESVLQTNEHVYAQLSPLWGPGRLVSLAPLLPSRTTQLANLARWKQFWQEPGRLPRLQETLKVQGRRLHFAEGTFEPFLHWLSQEHEPFDATELRRIAGPLLEPLFLLPAHGLGVINLIPDSEQMAETFLASGVPLPPGVQTVSQRRFASILQQSLEGDFWRFLLVSLGAVVLILAVLLRRLSLTILTLLPTITGLEVMLAAMVLLGLRVNMFNVAALVLVVGLSIDFGVFAVYRSREHSRAQDLAVATSALTTISGFGALSLAHHPAMFSLGITVILGLTPALLCALVVVPAWQYRRATS
jgi:predicted exporter